MKIKNDKPLQRKSRTHQVMPFYKGRPDSFTVLSGESGETYYVLLSDKGASCSCPWGQHRPYRDIRSGCSHIQSVFDWIDPGRRVNAWCDVEQAMRQHRPALDIGDGVTLTSRLIDWR